MIAEIKSALRLIGYGYGVKRNLIGGIIIWVLGILMFVTQIDQLMLAGGAYIILGPLMIVQIYYSLLYTNIVAACSKKKLLEIVIPDLLNVFASVIGFVVLIICMAIKVNAAPERAGDYWEMLLITSVMMALVMCFCSVAYKYYLLGTIVFVVAFFMIYVFGPIWMERVNLQMNIVSGAFSCLTIFVVGVLLSGLIRRGVYKKKLSLMACNTTLRKAL